MRSSGTLLIIMFVMILIDTYVFQAVKWVSHSASSRSRLIIYSIYWSLSILAVLAILSVMLFDISKWPRGLRNYVFAAIIGLFFAKLIGAVFFLLDDIRRLIQWASVKLFFRNTEGENVGGDGITRSTFLSWLGLGISGTLFSSLVYGFSNKYNYQIHRMKLRYDHLPPGFRGTRIIQISDIHSGSFTNQHSVAKGVEMIMNEKPDLILFTGDLVNDKSIEMNDYIEIFNKLSAPLGVYSTLGNHDYGDYAHWENEDLKRENLEYLKQIHAQMGWRLLMNEHVPLKKGDDEIALIGIENWSAKARFPKYGKMNLAYPGAEKYPFKILMSHDPSHWDAEVRPKYGDIDLTLAGHTHGMQFGIELPGFKWSPVQYVYRQWAGLYEEGKQKLYVNRGYGFIGYPGRVGILPEITVIELA